MTDTLASPEFITIARGGLAALAIRGKPVAVAIAASGTAKPRVSAWRRESFTASRRSDWGEG
jgi:hypothetical protein